jgi:Pentapeptide repeats (8 copies)
MIEQDGTKATALQRPVNDDKEAWKKYWQAQGQPWRTESEIDVERQKYLADRRYITPNIEQGIYPFKDIKLNRADVEWLLATHENGRGPVDWDTGGQWKRDSLDLRGADLRQANLFGLPLARMRGGLTLKESREATDEQRSLAAVHLQEAILYTAQLQGAILTFAQLQNADLRHAQLQNANLYGARLPNADLRMTDLDHATLDYVTFSDQVYGCTCFADIKWGEVNLALVDWGPVTRLGDERVARQEQEHPGTRFPTIRDDQYREAVRANRQLAVVLRAQGLNEEADHFAYRAHMLQRVVLRRQRKFGRYLFSGFLDLLAGYGYRPGRSVIWYLIIIFGFALAYATFGHLPFLPDSLVFSLTSFHGRGFFPGLGSENSLHNPLVIMAAFEAVVGLLIEISFIATFTQRFFGK